jgi:hypothetical protein
MQRFDFHEDGPLRRRAFFRPADSTVDLGMAVRG